MAGNDAELLERINRNKTKRRKYEAVIKVIHSNKLNESRSGDMSSMVTFIDTNREKVQRLDSDSGYAYLSTLSTKLRKDIGDLEDYVDFANDSIKSIQALCETLESKKKTLDNSISDDVDKYNEGKMFWEHEKKGDGWLW
ncbi:MULTISPECIES: hypothetical protein [Listeria]|uniref:DUF5082 domain-containing protein n=2 Tax=Listeria TaxID=1637 RepID=A0A7X1A504_9LIST|nr:MULTISPECIES: hypothetical protein [Listeria]EUJ43302.1 hypothetical protein PRIP_13289 [Listeria riparia FSL S10-1204]MBC1233700.1 hypothetical protein [Listeria booriae]MBC1245949.1 hypothetical protein [Listeria booriae]MBC1273878.1 hypothetical protein [Listeria booriae]MBC1290861.1 hypothetical protein [Listeria booriae]